MGTAATERVRIAGFHGGRIAATDARALYLAIGADARGLAEAYAGDGAIYAVECDAANPLLLDTGERVRWAWEQSQALACDGPFYAADGSSSQGLLNAWARELGHDAIVVPESAFEGEIGYEWAAGTFGEPQAVIFDPTTATIREA